MTAGGKPERHSRWRLLLIVVLIVAALLGIGRAILPWAVRTYVNHTIDRNALYSGRIGEIHVHLWRGAYSIRDVRLNKTTGNVPVPFFAAKRLDFQVQWSALFHGNIVSRILLQDPQLNFVEGSTSAESQTGGAGPWMGILQDLFPFKINRAVIRNGSVHYRSYRAAKPFDVYISRIDASIDDLTNIRNSLNPLTATIHASGLVMDQAKVDFRMTLDPFAYRPTFHMALRLLGLDVTKLNALALVYGKFDFKGGWLDLVIEADAKNGLLNGYVKPLFRNLKVFSLAKELTERDPLQIFWEALIGLVTEVLENQPRDQFGTLIPFTGDLSTQTTADILATIGNVLRNGFVRAYLPRLQPGWATQGTFRFQAPSFTQEEATANYFQ